MRRGVGWAVDSWCVEEGSARRSGGGVLQLGGVKLKDEIRRQRTRVINTRHGEREGVGAVGDDDEELLRPASWRRERRSKRDLSPRATGGRTGCGEENTKAACEVTKMGVKSGSISMVIWAGSPPQTTLAADTTHSALTLVVSGRADRHGTKKRGLWRGKAHAVC